MNTKKFTSINYLPVKRSKKLPNYAFENWTFYDERDIPFQHGEV